MSEDTPVKTKLAPNPFDPDMSIEYSAHRQRPLNWRVKEFCDAHGIGKTKFYGLVAEGKLSLIKCGKTSLIADAEARRFQLAIEAGEL